MRLAGSITLTAAACVLALAGQHAAHAQWGMVNLPRSDFTWVWGDQRRAEGSRPDIDLTGVDRGFHCHLTGRLRPSSRLSRMDVRNIENEIRVARSFVDATVYMMYELEMNRNIEWAVLDCERAGQDQDGSDVDTGPTTVTAWIEMEVTLREEFPAASGGDGGHWTASYTQGGSWRFRRSGSGRRASYTVRSERLLLPGALENVEASVYTVCHDGDGEAWRTQWEEPVQAEPVTLTSSSDGGRVVLWASLPSVWMQHPGHGHIPAGSDCRSEEAAFRDQFALASADLEAAGAAVDDDGAFRLLELSWQDLVEAVQGGEEVTFSMRHEASPGGRAMLFEIRGFVGQQRN